MADILRALRNEGRCIGLVLHDLSAVPQLCDRVLLLNGGHIGDGVRPSQRRKGIATKMIGLALEECRKLGISRVLMVCDKTNIGSAKSIQRNGGVLENEVDERYANELTDEAGKSTGPNPSVSCVSSLNFLNMVTSHVTSTSP